MLVIVVSCYSLKASASGFGDDISLKLSSFGIQNIFWVFLVVEENLVHGRIQQMLRRDYFPHLWCRLICAIILTKWVNSK